jgi:2',3'-cyclic-nucleotide 2'-phosphodiesterase (5'-nucleotidase family)
MRLAMILSVVLSMSCGERERAALHVATPAQPALRLVALTDLSGYLEPCGCQSKPLGGIDKAAAKLEAMRADHVPLLLLAAGDLLFGSELPGASSSDMDAATQEAWKAEALVGILDKLGLAAAAPGARDLSFGPDTLARLASKAHFALLPAKPGAAPAPESVASSIITAGTTRVGVLGISTFDSADHELPQERLTALRTRAQTEIDRLRKEGARLVVGLISSDQRSGRRLSSGLHGLDFAFQGGLDEPNTPVPARAGDAVLLRGGYQGQGLLVVDVYLDGDKPFIDVSAWTRREQRAALQARVDELQRRLTEWERGRNVDPASLHEQRQKLGALRTELAKSSDAPAAPSGNAFSARYLPLTTDIQGSSEIASLVDAYTARVDEHNKVAFAGRWPQPIAPGTAGYVGSAKCQKCHAEAYGWWSQHPHGRAYATLQKVHKEYNLSCVTCHVTGYEKPGGATLVHNEGLVNVGCESCHGPGSLHVAKPYASATALTEKPRESTCRECHTPEHSDLFDYAHYIAKLRVPGHGLPPDKAQAAAH